MPGQPFIRPAPLILLALAMSGCFVLGCIGQQPPETANATVNDTGPGFQPGGYSEYAGAASGVTLDEAISVLNDMGTENGKSSTGKNPVGILYIDGSSINAQGKASVWTIAIRSDNRTSIMTFSPQGHTTLPWKGETRWHEMNITAIIPPETLVNENREAIFPQTGNGTIRDLVLSEGIYTLTPAAPGSPATLSFNATTGERLA